MWPFPRPCATLPTMDPETSAAQPGAGGSEEAGGAPSGRARLGDWSGYGTPAPPAGDAPKESAFAAAWNDQSQDWGREYWAAIESLNGEPADPADPANKNLVDETTPAPTSRPTTAIAASLAPTATAPAATAKAAKATKVSGWRARRAERKAQKLAKPAKKKRRRTARRRLVPGWAWAMVAGVALTGGGALAGAMLAASSFTPWELMDAAATPSPSGTLLTQPDAAGTGPTAGLAGEATGDLTGAVASATPTAGAAVPQTTAGPLPGTPTKAAVPVVPMPDPATRRAPSATPAATPSRSATASSGPSATANARSSASPSAAATTPASSDPDAISEPEIAVAGPPSGLAITSEDRNFGSCPAKFSAQVTVEVAYGVPASATAAWSLDGQSTSGTTDLAAASYNTFQGTLSGMPTKQTVWLHVQVTGPDGSVKNEPFEITHPC